MPIGELCRTRKAECTQLELIISYAMSEEDAFRYETFMIELFYDTLLNQHKGIRRLLPVNLDIKKIHKVRKVQSKKSPEELKIAKKLANDNNKLKNY